MTIPKQHKAFLQQLQAHKQLSLADVMAIFKANASSTSSDVTATDMEQALYFLQVEDLFVIKTQDGQQEVDIEADLFKDPENYILAFNNFIYKDINIAEDYCAAVDESSLEQDEAGEYYIELRPYTQLKVVGNLAEAANLHERIRAYTQYFASNLVRKNFTLLSTMFAEQIAQKHSETWLSEYWGALEQDYGTFDYADHIEVISVYVGEAGAKKCFGEMALPEGVNRDARRGEARFQAVSVCTPNGMSIHGCNIYLAIIEQAGLFKVCNIHCQPL